MKKEASEISEQSVNRIKSQKDSFRRYQHGLSFSEKMQIAFDLAERDKTIRRAVLLPKKKQEV